jgi:hypothetical protein
MADTAPEKLQGTLEAIQVLRQHISGFFRPTHLRQHK